MAEALAAISRFVEVECKAAMVDVGLTDNRADRCWWIVEESYKCDIGTSDRFGGKSFDTIRGFDMLAVVDDHLFYVSK